MNPLAWLRPPRQLLALFAVVTLIPAAALVWLGWKVLEQDRNLERHQLQERLEATADRVARDLNRTIAAIGRNLPKGIDLAVPVPGATVVEFKQTGIERLSGAPLVFVPAVTDAAPTTSQTTFISAEGHEYRGDFAAAAREYRALSTSPDSVARPVALVRLAANLRKLGRTDEALDVYRSLSDSGGGRVADEPVELAARLAECRLLAQLDRRTELQTRAAALAVDLAEGRWRITRAAFERYRHELTPWTAVPDTASAAAVAEALERVWADRPWADSDEAQDVSSRSVWAGQRSVLLVWGRSGGRLFVYAVPTAQVHATWRSLSTDGMSLAFVDGDGRRVAGLAEPREGERVALRASTDTGLPWALRVTGGMSSVESAAIAARRRLIATALLVLVMLIPAGGFIVFRAVQKQLAALQVQSDFVSAVSHELRTPLTAMAHLTERLQRDEAIATDRRRQYYDVLAHDVDRLKRFVESLLDFGRMEAGGATLTRAPANLADVVLETVEEFKAKPEAGRHPIVIVPGDALPPVSLDKETFRRALWNLLDNAAKYSPDEAPIRVEIAQEATHAAVHVRDEGPGVQPEDKRRIFEKFVRGQASRSTGVRGTGVGLALAREIARAHGGEVRLTTELGRGSTFSLLVPLA